MCYIMRIDDIYNVRCKIYNYLCKFIKISYYLLKKKSKGLRFGLVDEDFVF